MLRPFVHGGGRGSGRAKRRDTTKLLPDEGEKTRRAAGGGVQTGAENAPEMFELVRKKVVSAVVFRYNRSTISPLPRRVLVSFASGVDDRL